MEGYNKTEAQTLGAAIFELIDAVSDGLDASDTGAAMNLLAKLSAASDEIRGDRDAAVLDVLSGLSGKLADSRRDDLQPPAAQ